ncbi:carbohydrate-binding module family 20 domain-containing protein [Actinoplanes sp. NEAU-A12]|uniref:Alpha-amylase n=1 Tax=Actinoplanes sandaracinus TaxID=3045177 RepID=A0ABT6WGT4_9ACTN|nr:carbohydrate-binding module family 20 domain-containing protein [Actinoplanes sandaracinus]MDI6098942.1 carbohydrate-binding module family 20 domain-containing protein [Actinoplanes sandaracinus]
MPGTTRTRRYLDRLLRRGMLAGPLTLAVMSTAVAVGTLPSPAQAAPPGDRDVTAVLFEWNYRSVARECVDTLGPEGYGFVQVSPPHEQVQGDQWWTSYQPVSYKIGGNRLGGQEDFRAMVRACDDAKVKVIVDVVINHMTSGAGVGTAGTRYTKYQYDGVYQDRDFHGCRRHIDDYRNRSKIQECELGERDGDTLSDLNTGRAHVQDTIVAYLDRLLAMGVAGFRVDAVKHIPADHLAAIRGRLSNPGAYWVQEVIHGEGEAVQPAEYIRTGDVQEFRYARGLKEVFEKRRLDWLENYGAGWNFLPSANAGVFVDNHDTERNGQTLNYKYGSDYTLANVFMLAHPYGSPHVHSGYAFSQWGAGPPRNGQADGCLRNDGWTCQHAWRPIANMVAFRNAAAGTGINDWWDRDNKQIAFGRGDKAFVAINGEDGPLRQTFQTGLPAGTYCDVQHGDLTADGRCTGPAYTVDTHRRVTLPVGANDAVALHAGARVDRPAAGTAFGLHATTRWGQDIFVVGDHPALGGWNPAAAVPLDAADHPMWRGTVALPGGTRFAYKYLRKEGGTVTWESGPDRTATVPASGELSLNDTWRP